MARGRLISKLSSFLRRVSGVVHIPSGYPPTKNLEGGDKKKKKI